MPSPRTMGDWKPDALFASNGSRDPAHLGTATTARDTLAVLAVRSDMPVMGICLGHQLMGLVKWDSEHTNLVRAKGNESARS